MDEDLVIRIAEAGADSVRLDELAGRLRRELDELDNVHTGSLRGSAPPGTRSVELAAVGAFWVSVKGPVQSIVSLIRSWLSRSPSSRTVEITLGGNNLKVGGVTAQQQEELIQQFLAAVRHE